MNRLSAQIKSIIRYIGTDRRLYLLVIDENGAIYSANRPMKTLLQLATDDTRELNLFDFIGASKRSELTKLIESSQRTIAPCSGYLPLHNQLQGSFQWHLHRLLTAEGDRKFFLLTGSVLTKQGTFKLISTLSWSQEQRTTRGPGWNVIFQQENPAMGYVWGKKDTELKNEPIRICVIKDLNNLHDINRRITIEDEDLTDAKKAFFFRVTESFDKKERPLNFKLYKLPKGGPEENNGCFQAPDSFANLTVVPNLTDLSMQKNLKTRPFELEAIFRSFMKETPNMAWVIDEDERLVYASKIFNDFFKLDNEALNKPVADLLPEKVVTFLYKKHKEVFLKGKPIQTIQKSPMADGSTLVFLVTIFPIEGASSKKMIGGHAINIAEKYEIEQKLKMAQERFLLLSHTTTDAIWEWDMQTGYIFRNDALMEMIGYQEMHNSYGLAWWLRRIHPEDRRRLEEKLKEATDKGLKSWEDEYRFKCADGVYKHIHDRGFIVYENGLPVRMIGSLNDITQVKLLQRQLEEEKLERQRQVSEIVLKVQEQERTKIGRELHDNVNQILSTCRLFIDMFVPGNREQESYKEKSLEYVQAAIDEIRTLSKELVLSDLKEMGLVEGVQKMIRDIQLSDKIRINFVHHIAHVQISSGKKITLLRIIQEQLKNILSYSGAKQVEISLEEIDGRVHLTIKDNGIGFDPKQTTRGIGLSNIYERTRFYDGTTRITTAPGKGCTLTVEIPVSN